MNMNKESNRQELAKRIVDREVYYCVSSLVSTLSDMAQHDCRSWSEQDIHWEDDILPLLESIDYEEAGTQTIKGCDDLDDLENMADGVGYWSDAVEATGYDSAQEYADSDGEMDTIDFETWFDEHNTDEEKSLTLDILRKYIIDTCTDWPEFCQEHDIDTDDFRNEVYEHWLVSDWLARRLRERGYVTGEICGLTIWGRCCTGQSIALDHVIQEIACELWPDEVLK